LNNPSLVGGRARASRSVTAAATPLKVCEHTLDSLAGVFKLLADKSRLKIMLALAQDRELHVGALAKLLGQSQPAVSHHLHQLREESLVTFRRHGKHNLYSLSAGSIRTLLEQFFTDAGSGQPQLQCHDFVLTFRRRR
jgi:DNA-binding transcriptional ArsR family regulator